MRHAVSNELYAYWRALRKGRAPPERNEIEPGAIRSVLADTFVLHFDAHAGFPFRISGSNVNAIFLKELRGVPFLEIWRESDRGRVRSILETAADEEAPVVLLAEARPAGLAPVEVEVALLPLRHQGATHARMLGSLTAGAGADWLGLIGSGPAALVGWRRLEDAATGAGPRAHPPARLGLAVSTDDRRGNDEVQTLTSIRLRPAAKRFQLSR